MKIIDAFTKIIADVIRDHAGMGEIRGNPINAKAAAGDILYQMTKNNLMVIQWRYDLENMPKDGYPIFVQHLVTQEIFTVYWFKSRPQAGKWVVKNTYMHGSESVSTLIANNAVRWAYIPRELKHETR